MAVNPTRSSKPRTESASKSQEAAKKSEASKPREARKTAPERRPVDAFEQPAPVKQKMSLRAPVAARPAASIDPRIASEAGIQLSVTQRSQGPAGSFDVKTVAYQNDQQSGGNHNVYVRILDANGKEIPPADLERYFDVQTVAGPEQPVTSASTKLNDAYGVKQDAWTTSANTGGPTQGYFDVPLWGGNATQVWVKPKDVPGNPYAGFGSQQVGPFSMPANHHVNYLVTFQATPAGAAPAQPSEPPVGTVPSTPPATEPSQVPALSQGAEGPEVLALQQELVRAGYMTAEQVATGPGTFGPRTAAAVTSFQLEHGLPATGVYDAATREALAAAPTKQAGGVTGPGPVGAPGSVYAPYEVAPGVQVNGRLGAHWPVVYDSGNPGQVDAIIAKMKEMGVGYTTLNISPGELAANQANIQQVFDKLQAAGITPVVRLYEPESPDQWTQKDHIEPMAKAAVTLGQMGVKLIQFGNEPNIETKLEGRPGVSKEQYLRDSVARQVDALVAIQGALSAAGLGGQVKVGIPPMAAGASDGAQFAFAPDTYFKALVQGIAERERTLSPRKQLVDWIPTHTYIWEDGENSGKTPGSGGARGQMGWGPETGPWFEQWARDALGYAPKSLSTEGGASPDSFRIDKTDQVARELESTLAQLQGNKNLTGCLWLEWESVPKSNTWDRSVFTPHDGPADGAWRDALPAYRDAYRKALEGQA